MNPRAAINLSSQDKVLAHLMGDLQRDYGPYIWSRILEVGDFRSWCYVLQFEKAEFQISNIVLYGVLNLFLILAFSQIEELQNIYDTRNLKLHLGVV